MNKLTRIVYNPNRWAQPAFAERKLESSNTYRSKFGFAHEDWLFRWDWMIGEWRYAFIQGVNKSRQRLLKKAVPIDLRLFTVVGPWDRRFVANIRNLEVLDDRQAELALAEFKAQGWFDQMLAEIRNAGGDSSALDTKPEYAEHILNVRFRKTDVEILDQTKTVPISHRIYQLHRYALFNAKSISPATSSNGSTSLPGQARQICRLGAPSREYTPEHGAMQRQLMIELRREFPGARVIRERQCVDVTVLTSREIRLYEIKSDLDPKTVLRNAMGQILEYGFFPTRKHGKKALSLIIVGRKNLNANERAYLNRLREIGLPIEYRTVTID